MAQAAILLAWSSWIGTILPMRLLPPLSGVDWYMGFQTMDILASRQAQLCYVTFCPRAAHGSGQVQALAEITSLLGSCPLVSLSSLLLHRILLNSSHSRNHMYLNPSLRLCSQRTKSKTLFHKVVIMTSEDRVFFVVVVCLFFPLSLSNTLSHSPCLQHSHFPLGIPLLLHVGLVVL